MSVTDPTTPDDVDEHIVAALTELQALGRCIAELDEILTARVPEQPDGAS